ncbi:MAG TPA: triphosphoribosyl-dephospho-CoA synthase [Isosphaeraceae bacterium]|jgi:triphosphoribosyl-dephospho-CoA synthase|nr:triphosphoribosyl-dephospho-CoA synthase [Isosphaeraceae bacterium]
MSQGPGPGVLAQIACILEVSARKPGNVHPGIGFDDATSLDFYLSAAAIARPLDRAREVGVGAAVLEAVEATRHVVATNTNLGMILLLAPLAAVPEGVGLRNGVAEILAATTIEDARLVYRAIRLARPGGLGTVTDQDVAGEPSVTLRDAMRLAADRDLVARQYAEDYVDVFDLALPALRAAIGEEQPLETAIVRSFLTVLSHRPDTLILRKCGPAVAAEASRRAAVVLDAPDRLADLDAWLRADFHARNPGATADLVAAALFVALADGTIPLPRPPGPGGWSGRGDGG